jgi:trehalose 6-phosphate phosphatase
MARPLEGAADLLGGLVERYAVVAVVTGRPEQVIRDLLPVPGLEVHGLYGLALTTATAEGVSGVRPQVEEAVRDVPGAWIEDKGMSLAVHFRGAPDPEAAQDQLGESLQLLATAAGLTLLPGKMVLEVAPAAVPGKGTVVIEAIRGRSLTACLYAGDDTSDQAAFEALDVLRLEGVAAVKVAVRGAETPRDLIDAADVVAEGPSGLLQLLGSLLH